MVIITRELIILYEKLKVNEKQALRKKKIFLFFLKSKVFLSKKQKIFLNLLNLLCQFMYR